MGKPSTNKMSNAFTCTRCQAVLSVARSSYTCPKCAMIYPVLKGIPVLYRAPLTLIEQFERLNANCLTSLQRQLDRVRILKSSGAITYTAASRGRALLQAQLSNLRLIRQHTHAPSALMRSKLRQTQSELRWQSGGWEPQVMLDYFYRDWCNTAEERMAYKIVNRLLRTTGSWDKADSQLAVLGCGAGGLLSRLAPQFQTSFGVDLSLPTLALAQRITEGGFFRFWKAFPQEGAAVPIKVKGHRDRSIRWVAADALDLPFGDGSINCVITQHLFDIVPDRSRLAAEVNRVLKPGGLWIEFSHGGFRSSVDQFGRYDLKGFLEKENFEVGPMACKAIPFLDFSRLRKTANQQIRTTFIFSATKGKSEHRNKIDQAFYEYFQGHSSRILSAVPDLNQEMTKALDLNSSRLLALVDGRRDIRRICKGVRGGIKKAPMRDLTLFADLFRSNIVTMRLP